MSLAGLTRSQPAGIHVVLSDHPAEHEVHALARAALPRIRQQARAGRAGGAQELVRQAREGRLHRGRVVVEPGGEGLADGAEITDHPTGAEEQTR